MSSVALIGSSGGGGATLGHTDPVELLTTINRELGRIRRRRKQRGENKENNNENNDNNDGDDDNDDGRESSGIYGLQHALFVSLHGGKGMDSTDPQNDMATLYTVGCCRHNGDNRKIKFHVKEELTGTLLSVNERCRELQSIFLVPSLLFDDDTSTSTSEKKKEREKIIGLICLSCDPTDVNLSTLTAAAKAGIPITGSGGTSLGQMAALAKDSHMKIVGNAGGSVATTTYTRAVSYCTSLVAAWNCDGGDGGVGEYEYQYSPLFEPEYSDGGSMGENDCDGKVEVEEDGDAATAEKTNKRRRQRPHIVSVLNACLPAFLAVCLTVRVLESVFNYVDGNGGGLLFRIFEFGHRRGWNSSLEFCSSSSITLSCPSLPPAAASTITIAKTAVQNMIYRLRYGTLPTVCAVVTATEYAPEHGSTAVMASVLGSSMGSCDGSVLAGLFVGWFVSFALPRVLQTSIRLQIPATTANILSAGILGSITSLLVLPLTPILSFLTHTLRIILHHHYHPLLHQPIPRGIGFGLGCAFVYGSKVGWYHTIMLPIILLEMEVGDASLFGAVDVCALVAVSAGVCAGELLVPMTPLHSPPPASGGDVDDDNAGEGTDVIMPPASISNTNTVTNPTANTTGITTDMAKRGLITNTLFGDFVEVAYPSMERSCTINRAVYIGAGIATEILLFHLHTTGDSGDKVVVGGVGSSAYLPIIGSILLAYDQIGITLAVAVSFGIPFVVTVGFNVVQKIMVQKTTRVESCLDKD